MSLAPRLGAFEVLAPIGRGGMGRVFSGRHVASGAAVAIKVVSSPGDEKFRRSFRDEVRAVASLAHPGIVSVFDHGVVSASAADHSRGELTEGAPYLVMELTTEGTLRSIQSAPWPWLRPVLIELLDALAHAHARHVIHRDIKPGNVLLDAPRPGRPRIRLTDFGIAHAAGDSGPSRLLTTGTPHYMAPEQIEGRWIDTGPWTDLYAVGCLTYRLLTRRPPFWAPHLDVKEVFRRHMHEDAPPLESVDPVSEPVRVWLSTLLAKRPRDRFQCAADAIAALPDAVAGTGSPVAKPRDLDPTLVSGAPGATLSELPTVFTISLEPCAVQLPDPPRRGPRFSAAALPADWRARAAPPADPAYLGARLALQGLQPVRLIGRELQRDAIYEALKTAHRERANRALLLRGPLGAGKSAIAATMATRTSELGGHVLRLDGSRPDPIGHMLGRFLHTWDLSAAAAMEPTLWKVKRLGGTLQDAVPLVQLTHPRRGNAGGPRVRFGSPKERYQAAIRLVELLGRERAVFVCVEDAGHHVAVLELVEALLDRELGALCVLTIDDKTTCEYLERLRRHARTAELTVDPLSAEEHRRLVDGLIGGASSRAAEIIARHTRGEPLLAVHMVGDWIQRGGGTAGAELDDTPVEPTALDELWMRRVLEATRRSGTGLGLEAAERGAALGHAFTLAEWSAVCGEDVDGLAAAMQLAGLILRRGPALAFLHRTLEEALAEHARAAGRWQSHHKRCAETLEAAPRAGTSARIARHRAASGALEAAVTAALGAARELFLEADYRGAEQQLRARERWLDELDAPPDDARRVDGWLELASIAARQARVDEAAAWVDRLERALPVQGQGHLRARVLCAKAKNEQMAGELTTATELFERAHAGFEGAGDVAGCARSAHGIADLLKQQSRLDEALGRFREAQDAYRLAGDEVGYAGSLMGEADIHIRRDPAAGRMRLRAAAEACERAGHRMGMAIALLFEGLALRGLDDLDGAQGCFERCAQTLESLGSADVAVLWGNIGFLYLMRDEPARAEPWFDRALARFVSDGREGSAEFTRAELLCCHAAAGHWTRFDERADGLAERLGATGVVDEDLVFVFERAARSARAAGHLDRARWAETVAAGQRAALTPPSD